MPAQIAFQYSYYDTILDRLKKMEMKNNHLHWQPSTREHIKGGVRENIVNPGQKATYPIYNSDDLYEINHMKYNRPPMQGGKSKQKRPYKIVGQPDENLHNHQVKLLRKIHDIHMNGGNVKGEVKRIAKKYGPTVLSGLLDLAPGAAGLAGSMLGSPVAGAAASIGAKIGRDAIKHYTGYGHKKKGKGIKKIAKNVAKAVIPSVLDAVPAVVGLGGTAYGGPTVGTAAHIAAKLGREGIRSYTGYGHKKGKKGKGLKQNIQKALPHVLDVAIPAAFSYMEHDPINYYNHANHGATSGRILGHIVRKGVKKITGYGRDKVGRPSKEDAELLHVLLQDMRKKNRFEGGSLKKLGKNVYHFLRNKLASGVRYGTMAIAKQLCAELGIDEQYASSIANFLNEAIEANFGFNPKPVFGEGHSKKPKAIKMEGKKGKTQAQNNGRRQQRNELVKQLMREKGMKLGEASRYIKQNNLM